MFTRNSASHINISCIFGLVFKGCVCSSAVGNIIVVDAFLGHVMCFYKNLS